MTNEKVLELAALEVGKPIYLFTDMWQRAKFSLLGHIIRAKPEDPMRQVTFEENTYKPRQPEYRRPGKPRDQFIIETMKEAFDELVDNIWFHYNEDDPEHTQIIVDAAIERTNIFAPKYIPPPTNLYKDFINPLYRIDSWCYTGVYSIIGGAYAISRRFIPEFHTQGD